MAHRHNKREAAEALLRGLPVAAPQMLRFRDLVVLELNRLKRATATQSNVPRNEGLWDPRDGALESRLALELDLIRRKRSAGYFLAVHDLIREAGASGTIIGPGTLCNARRNRLVVRGPDVNALCWTFCAEGEQGVRVGLMAVKGAREEEVFALLEEREHHGPYANLEDLLRRVRRWSIWAGWASDRTAC